MPWLFSGLHGQQKHYCREDTGLMGLCWVQVTELSQSLVSHSAVTDEFRGASVRILCSTDARKSLLGAWPWPSAAFGVSCPSPSAVSALMRWSSAEGGQHFLMLNWNDDFPWLWKWLYFPLKCCSREKPWLFCGRQEISFISVTGISRSAAPVNCLVSSGKFIVSVWIYSCP